MKRLVSVFVVTSLAPLFVFAANSCPKVIAVEVKGLKSISASNFTETEKIFKAGDQQTAPSYISTVLESVNKITDLEDTLKLVKVNKYDVSYLNSCLYAGKNSRLTIFQARQNEKSKAVLSIGFVDYTNETSGYNPTAAKGFQADLTSDLKVATVDEVAVYKTKPSKLTLPLDVQIPLGDYGTDGYTEDAEIGSAKSVTYTVLQ